MQDTMSRIVDDIKMNEFDEWLRNHPEHRERIKMRDGYSLGG